MIWLLWACGGGEAPEPARPVGRGDVVLADPARKIDLDGFCDARPNTPFSLPELTEEGPALSETGWTWVNVWATWCGPCVEEMPRLVEWTETLNREGHPIELQLISTDAEAGALRKFYAKHTDFPTTTVMADATAAPAWIAELGMEGAALPVHVFVDREQRISCIRAGALSKSNLTEVRALVTR